MGAKVVMEGMVEVCVCVFFFVVVAVFVKLIF